MFLPKRIVFAGGGTRCLIFLPALKKLEIQNRLQTVEEWWGTSAGALLASLMAITKSVDRVESIMKTTDFQQFRDVNLMNMMQITSAWGFDDGIALTKGVEQMLETAQEGMSKKTLGDVKSLHIVVADLTKHKSIVCSAKNYPTLRIADAIRASMSLPMFYRPFRSPIDNAIWVDGGLKENFPWGLLPSDVARNESLGFSFERTWMGGPKTFSEYMFSMLHFDEPNKIVSLKQSWKHNIIWFPSPPFPAWYVKLQEDDFKMLDQMGSVAFEEWLSKENCSGICQNQPESERDPHIPLPVIPEDHTNGMSDSQKYSSPSEPPFSHPRQHMTSQLPSRRWSL